jgi:transposase, IS6 family
MRSCRPALFRKRQFEPIIIVTCVRWYCRFSLSLRDLEELMAERGLAVDHTTIWRWVQRYGPEVPPAAGECETKIFYLAHG